MSDVNIGFGKSASETAVLLLAAAEKKGLDATEVRTNASGFIVSEEIAEEAGFIEKKKPAKKAAAKKTAAKKTTAKKTTTKKSASKSTSEAQE